MASVKTTIGIPKEIKTREYRVAMTPWGVQELLSQNNYHKVFVETGAGLGVGFTDDMYEAMGATICTQSEAWSQELVIKVKEPIESEYKYLRNGLTLFTYLHLAADEQLTIELINKNVCAYAYETLTLPDGSLPLLQPMSAIAGRMASQIGATLLQKDHGGRGILMGGVEGVRKANVLILGGGVVGKNAADVAIGMGANVTVLDINPKTLQHLKDKFGNGVNLLYSNINTIKSLLPTTDLVVGAVLIPGGRAPHLITKEMLPLMPQGSAIVDVAVDQGGCVESCHPTTHDNPTYVIDGVTHYCVANMPGAVPETSTLALTNATLPYIKALANGSFEVKYGTKFYGALNITNSCFGVNGSFKGSIANDAVYKAMYG